MPRPIVHCGYGRRPHGLGRLKLSVPQLGGAAFELLLECAVRVVELCALSLELFEQSRPAAPSHHRRTVLRPAALGAESAGRRAASPRQGKGEEQVGA
eukprot:SAG11_NODE_16716_length_539_cov_1.552273_1_plen_97_part_10